LGNTLRGRWRTRTRPQTRRPGHPPEAAARRLRPLNKVPTRRLLSTRMGISAKGFGKRRDA